MRTCVINFADGIFTRGQERLKRSLESTGFTGDIILYTELPPEWPSHDRVPWGFKVYAFEEARKQGYSRAIWIDAAGIAIRPLEPLLRTMEREGAFLFSRYSSSVGEWSSDIALEQWGISREKAFHIPEISAFCIGIDFTHPKGQLFLDEWRKCADDGISFIGVRPPHTITDSMGNDTKLLSTDARVKGHRHDQTAASVIAHRLCMKPTRRLIFDIVGEAKSGRQYSRAIPLDAVIVQNRDVKSNHFANSLDAHWNKTGAKKRWQQAINTAYSLLRYAKDLVKWILVLRKRYNT